MIDLTLYRDLAVRELIYEELENLAYDDYEKTQDVMNDLIP